MHWGNEEQKEKYLRYFMEQYVFLKDPQEEVPYLPVALDVDICNRCNLKCISCFHSSERFGAKKDMTWETFVRIMDQAEGKAGVVTFGNHGEPFMHKQAIEMMREVKRRGFFLNIINNGTLLDKAKADQLLDVRPDRVSFSVDSVDPRQYGGIRRNADLHKTLTNILYFLDINLKAGMPIFVNISTVNTKEALASDPTVQDYFAKLPVDVVYQSTIINFQDSTPVREQTMWRKENLAARTREETPVCLNGFDRLLIRPDGGVSLCPIDWESIHVLGNVNQTPYDELWNNKAAREFRRAVISRDYSGIDPCGKLCSVCDAKWMQNVETHRQKIVETLMHDLHGFEPQGRDMGEMNGRSRYLAEEIKRLHDERD